MRICSNGWRIICLAVWACLLVAGPVQSQQEVQYSLFALNPFGFNPAYAGLEESLTANAVVRRQWTGVEGSPFSQQANAHLPWYYARGGIGIRVENDLIGAHRTTVFGLAYNYWLPIGQRSTLSIGLEAGLQQVLLRGDQLRTPEGYYEAGALQHNDNLLPAASVAGRAPLAGIGVYFQNQNWEMGLSVRNITSQEIKLAENSFAGIAYNRNYFFNFATNLRVGKSLRVHPALLLKSDFIQTQADLGALVHYNEQFFAGAFYRGFNATTTDALVLASGIRLNSKWTLAYAFDVTLSALKSVNQGSHEIVLHYHLNKDIGKGKLPGIIYNSRHL